MGSGQGVCVSACVALWVAWWVDRRFGEPPVWAHPVVAMGRYLGALGPRMTTWPAHLGLAGGTLAWALGALLVLCVALAIEVGAMACAQALWLYLWPDGSGFTGLSALGLQAVHGAALGLCLKPLMAWRMLASEVSAVESALGQSLPAGQQQLARLVSRDVTVLDDTQVRESAIETLAENLNDSVVAPLFWFVLLGLPGAALYRFANTADAMWGYRGRYEWVGKWAARADDALSWVPARLTALALCLAAGRWPGWPQMQHEAAQTPSPNGGWPMGTMALLLGVRLRKPGVYALHALGREARAVDTAQALQWADQAVRQWLWVLTVLLLLAAALSPLGVERGMA